MAHRQKSGPAVLPKTYKLREIFDNTSEASQDLRIVVRHRMRRAGIRSIDEDDVLQELRRDVYVRFDQEAGVAQRVDRALLLRMLDNRISDLARREFAEKRGGHRGAMLSLDDPRFQSAAEPYAGSDAESRLETLECRELVGEAISMLPRSRQSLLRRVFFRDLSAAEIARELGVNRSAVSQRIARALEDLARHLRPKWNIDDTIPIRRENRELPDALGRKEGRKEEKQHVS